MPGAVGFVGFGEVASIFADAMRNHGVQVAAYDLDPAKVVAAGVSYRPLPELLRDAEFVLSTVTTSAALAAAKSCAPFLDAGHTYVDLNSTAPSVKIAIEQAVRPTGASFVEGAILGAVGVTGARTRILTGGGAAREATAALAALGLHVSFYSEQTGKAATFKMLRSIFSKGLEALLIELLVAGKHAGIDEDLWRDVVEFMTGNPFNTVAANWIRTHAVAHDRRHHEMVQVVETMRDIGVEPLMTAATEQFFRRSRTLGLGSAFDQKPPMQDVVAFFDRALHNRET